MCLQFGLHLERIVDIQVDRLGQEPRLRGYDDYITFYAAGRLVLEGRGDDLYDIDAIGRLEREVMGRPVGGSGTLPYFNPPFVAALFAPLTLLSVEAFAMALLFLISALAIAGGLALDVLLRPATRGQRLVLWVFYLSLFSVIWLVIQLQLSMLLFFGWFGFVWFQIKGKDKWSGAVLALALVKPQMVLLPLALLLWKRQWSALKGFALVAVPLVGLSIVVAGPQVLVDYPLFLLESTSWETNGVKALSMYGGNSILAGLIGDNSPPHALLLLFGLPSLAAAAWVWRGRWQPQQPRFLLQVGVLLIAALLLNAHLYMQDLVLLALLVCLWTAYLRRTGKREAEMVAVAGSIWLLLLYEPHHHIFVDLNLLTPLMALLLIRLVIEACKVTEQHFMADARTKESLPPAA